MGSISGKWIGGVSIAGFVVSEDGSVGSVSLSSGSCVFISSCMLITPGLLLVYSFSVMRYFGQILLLARAEGIMNSSQCTRQIKFSRFVVLSQTAQAKRVASKVKFVSLNGVSICIFCQAGSYYRYSASSFKYIDCGSPLETIEVIKF